MEKVVAGVDRLYAAAEVAINAKCAQNRLADQFMVGEVFYACGTQDGAIIFTNYYA